MEKKIALVTGANKGIGLEACRQLAEAGFAVILSARDTERGKLAAIKLRKQYPDLIFHQLDVTDKQSIHRMVEFIWEKFGVLDVLVNNAGIISSNSDSSTVKIEDVRKVFDTNFFGPLALSQAMIPLLKKSRDGRIINVSSGMGSVTEPGSGHFAYRSSKASLNGLTAIMAADLAGTNIKVNALCPGWVRTDMGGEGAPRNPDEGADTITWLATENKIPSGRIFRDRKEIEW